MGCVGVHRTFQNIRGALATCLPSSSSNIVAFPAEEKGWIRIIDFVNCKGKGGRKGQFPSHKGEAIFIIAINLKGTMLAAASDQGTVIKVFSILPPQSQD